jgi:chitinase
VLTQAAFDDMFPHREEPACSGAIFTYAALLEASKAFPQFASQGTLDDRKRELAAFLANAGHETTGGWAAAPGGPQAWGLCFREELGCDSGACTGYCVADATYPCAPGKTYHGRGPLQLSYNYNYGQAGDALSLPLLATPELVAMDGVIAFKAALWFWMTAQAPKPSCHDVMVGQWQPSAADLAAGRQAGFGMTVNIINGGLECNQPTPPQVADRVAFYQRFTTQLGVTPGDAITCEQMQHY